MAQKALRWILRIFSNQEAENEVDECLRCVLDWHGFRVTKLLFGALFSFILSVKCIFRFGY